MLPRAEVVQSGDRQVLSSRQSLEVPEATLRFGDGWKGCGAPASCGPPMGFITGAQDPGGLGTACTRVTGPGAFSPPLILESLHPRGDEPVPDGLL